MANPTRSSPTDENPVSLSRFLADVEDESMEKQMSIKRFGYEVRNGDNRLIHSVGGFDTRESAETVAQCKREDIKRRGWNMRVYVTEAHQVS